MRNSLLIQSCVCLLAVLTPTLDASNYSYPQYPVRYYPQPVIYNTVIQQPYALPLYSAGAATTTAVISGGVSYSHSITTLAEVNVQTTVQGVLGAEQAFAAEARVQEAEKAYSTTAPHLSLLRRYCAKCHSGTSARAGFKIFDGQSFVLSPKDLSKVFFRLTTTKRNQAGQPLRMPPDAKIAEADRDVIMEGLVTSPESAQAPEPKKEEGF